MNELFHYGTKGQKWGERRYQNKDGTWTEEGKLRRRKSIKLYRVTEKTDDKNRSGMYVSTEKDVDKYIGVYGRYLKKIGKDAVLKELQVSRNLKVPSYKQSKEIMKHTLDSLSIKDDPKKIELLNKHFNESMFTDDDINDLYRKAGSDFKKYLKNGSVGNSLYDCLNVDLCFRRSKIMQEIATEFYRKNNHFGYDAVKDMNDVKYSLYKSNLPLIITNIDKISSTKIRELTDSDINRSRTKLGQKYLNRFNQWDKEVDEWLAEEKKNNR